VKRGRLFYGHNLCRSSKTVSVRFCFRLQFVREKSVTGIFM